LFAGELINGLEYIMQSSEYDAELSKCVRCGSCKAYCPTYDEGLTEAMGARGRLTLLRGLLNGELNPSPRLRERIFSCILCGACEQLCPPHLEITEAIYHGRKLLGSTDRRGRYLGYLMRFSVKSPMLTFRIAQMLQHTLYPYLAKMGVLPSNITMPHSPLRDNQQVYHPEKKIGRVALFTGCSINFLFPYLGVSLINVLMRLGYEVIVPKGEVCCGAPFRSLGLEDDAVKMAQKNHKIFSKLNAEAVLSLCPTCVLSLKVHYPKLIGEGIQNVMDVSSFLLHKLEPHHFSPVQSLKTMTYHDPCHLSYSLGIRKEPRELIRLTGAEFIDAEGDGCCGFGGIFSVCYRDLSRDLMKKRMDSFRKTGAEAIITSCPGCMLQLGSGIKDKPVFHIIELLEEVICGKNR
jgi:glycolate oxidase iron-sulfur subunit